jgi:hypothetical protein
MKDLAVGDVLLDPKRKALQVLYAPHRAGQWQTAPVERKQLIDADKLADPDRRPVAIELELHTDAAVRKWFRCTAQEAKDAQRYVFADVHVTVLPLLEGSREAA